jgi:hypothetical protein
MDILLHFAPGAWPLSRLRIAALSSTAARAAAVLRPLLMAEPFRLARAHASVQQGADKVAGPGY